MIAFLITAISHLLFIIIIIIIFFLILDEEWLEFIIGGMNIFFKNSLIPAF